MLRRWKRLMFAIAGCGAGLLVPGITAQSVALEGGILSIRDGDGNRTWAAGFSGSSVAGGSGSCGSAQIENQDDVLTVFSNCLGDLFLGGGNDDGDVQLTDSDGVTTTVSLDGQLGLVELGSPDDDGDLWIWNHNTDDQRAIDLNGATGTASQQLSGNGFVKAWAKINADGTVAMCYLCNISPAETQKLAIATYEVSFSPLASDIRARPRLAMIDGEGHGSIAVSDRQGDHASIRVTTMNHQTFADQAFTVLIF